MKVERLMTRDVKTARGEDNLHLVAQIMWENDCGCVPIVDQELRVTGMVTDRDICMAGFTQDRPLREIRVSTAMSKKVCICRPESTLESVERTMQENKVRRLPVIDADERLVGLVSLNDLAREAARERKQRSKEISDAEIGETLGVICERSREKEMAPSV